METELVKNVFWTGHVDWPVRNFHGYVTDRGSTYNAYLVKGEKTAVIDCVKAPFSGEYLENIAKHVDLSNVAYVVCNHAEPDHSGALPAVMSACENATLVCNAKCKDALALYYDISTWKTKIVADGDSLALGAGKTLKFFNTPMVHWPESMMTYIVEDEILFSMDAFGQHYASPFRFDDESDISEVMAEARTYYANIVMPFGKPVASALGRLSDLPLKIVAPSHGVIWRKHFGKILEAYKRWMICAPAGRKIVIAYSTMWGSTKKMAEAIASGASDVDGVEVHLFDLGAVNDTQLVTEVMDSAAFVAGSPTLNQGIMPRMASALTYLRGLKPMGKKGFSFGSYGWASKGAEEVEQYFSAMNIELVRPALKCRFSPDSAMLEECRTSGRLLAISLS